jgi:hypothetical protein
MALTCHSQTGVLGWPRSLLLTLSISPVFTKPRRSVFRRMPVRCSCGCAQGALGAVLRLNSR